MKKIAIISVFVILLGLGALVLLINTKEAESIIEKVDGIKTATKKTKGLSDEELTDLKHELLLIQYGDVEYESEEEKGKRKAEILELIEWDEQHLEKEIERIVELYQRIERGNLDKYAKEIVAESGDLTEEQIEDMWNATPESIESYEEEIEAFSNEFGLNSEEFLDLLKKNDKYMNVLYHNDDPYRYLSPEQKWLLIERYPAEGDEKVRKHFEENPDRKEDVVYSLRDFLYRWHSKYYKGFNPTKLPRGLKKIELNEDSLIFGKYLRNNEDIVEKKDAGFRIYFLADFVFEDGRTEEVLIESAGYEALFLTAKEVKEYFGEQTSEDFLLAWVTRTHSYYEHRMEDVWPGFKEDRYIEINWLSE